MKVPIKRQRDHKFPTVFRVTPRLEKNQPSINAPFQSFNDGILARCSSPDDYEIAVTTHSGSHKTGAQRPALRKEELRFHPEHEMGKSVAKERQHTSSMWRLLHGIQRLLKPPEEKNGGRKRGPAVCGCGFASMENEDVTLHVKRTGARAKGYVTGVYRCGSPWLCPYCTKKGAAERQSRVQDVAEATLKKGGLFCHVVVTIRHKRADALAELKAAVGDSSRAARQGRQWKTLQKKMGAVGVLSAPEVTYSLRHGWHYHLHLALPLLIADATVAREGCIEFVERYLAEIRKRGFDANWNGQQVSISRDPQSAASYVGKGLSWEFAGGTATKTMTRSDSSLSPFEIAKRAMEGSEKMTQLWLEYAQVMQGTRSCVVTASIARALDIVKSDESEEDNFDDEADLDEEKTDVVGTIPTMNWNILLRKGHVPELFDKLETSTSGAWSSIRKWALEISSATTLRASDIPIDPRDIAAPSAERFVQPLAKPERARTIAWRSREYMNGQRFIQEQVSALQRDEKRFGVPSPSLLDVAMFLATKDHLSKPIFRALEKSEQSAILSPTENLCQLESQPCFEGPQNAFT